MHRSEDTPPLHHTQSTIKAIAPVDGHALGTATGLGYARIEATRTAQQLVTIEPNPTVQRITRLNPWSRALLEDPGIDQIIGDSFDEIEHSQRAYVSLYRQPPQQVWCQRAQGRGSTTEGSTFQTNCCESAGIRR